MSEKTEEKPVSPFAKWEDKETKVNPFEPVKFKKEGLGFPWKLLRPVMSAFFALTRFPCVVSVLFVAFFMHLAKYALLVP